MSRKLLSIAIPTIFILLLQSCATTSESPRSIFDDASTPEEAIAIALEEYGMDPEEKARVQAAELLTDEERQEMIDKQFDPWDGSHITVKAYIIARMNNPKSFDHIETIYYDDFDSIRVYMTYRGTNAFNAVVTNRVGYRLALDGTPLELLER